MAHANAPGAGSYIQMGSPLVTIEGVLEIGGLVGGAKPVIDMTAINDTRSKSVVGVPGPVTQTLKLAWDPANAQHAALWAASAGSQAAIAFKEVFSDAGAAEATYSAYVTSFEMVPEKAGGLIANVTLALSTEITLTP